MPAVGRKQKPPGHAVNRHATLEWSEVPNVPYSGRPKLPATRPNGDKWPLGIRERWTAWSTMPHCVLWTPTDWQFAIDTLSIAARFTVSCDPRDAAELRNREKVMGTTLDYRRDIRVRYVDPPTG